MPEILGESVRCWTVPHTFHAFFCDIVNDPRTQTNVYHYSLSLSLSLFVPGLSLDQLRHLKRRPFNGLSKEAIRLFQLSPAEVEMVRAFEKWLDPNVIQPGM